MSRINTNVSALIAQHNLARANDDLNTRLEHLSTGLRISRGADDPAGLIVSERLRSEITGVTQAIDNAGRASNVIATSEAALSEISTLLTTIKGLTIEAANRGAFSDTEVQANQLQIDSAVDSITRISNTTSFAGLKLLNGSLDYLTSGVNPSEIQDVKVFGANFGTATNIPVNVEVLNSAQTANLYIDGDLAGTGGTLVSSVTFELKGTKGVEVLSFVSGQAMSAIAFAINQVNDATGVSASLVNPANPGSGIMLSSQAYGSDAFVAIEQVADQGRVAANFGTFEDSGFSIAKERDTGEDVLALINGNLALGKGRSIGLRSSLLNIEMNLTVAAATTLGNYSFAITGGGATYQIGQSIDSSNQVGFGIQSVAASKLGADALGFLNSIVSGGDNSLINRNEAQASQIVDSAINQIAFMRGRLGSFERNTLQTSIRSQQIALENLTASESQIRDTDFAKETAALTRSQILVRAGTSTLALANSTAQSVLSLLGQ